MSENQYTVEPHGKGYAIYLGRSNDCHGANLGHLTECDGNLPDLIEKALNRLDSDAIENYCNELLAGDSRKPKFGEWFSVNGDWLRIGDKATGTRYDLKRLASYWCDEYSINFTFEGTVGHVTKTLFKEYGEDGRELRRALDDYFTETNS